MGITDETAVMGMCVKFFNQRANINEGRCVSLHIRTALQLSNNNSLTELLSAVRTEKSASNSIYFFSARHPLGARTESARLQTYLHTLQHFDSMLQAAIETYSTHTHTQACSHSQARPILTEKTDLLSCSWHHVLSVSYTCHGDVAQTAREREQSAMNGRACNEFLSATASGPSHAPATAPMNYWDKWLSLCVSVSASLADESLCHISGYKKY